jgi:hypothetical protein
VWPSASITIWMMVLKNGFKVEHHDVHKTLPAAYATSASIAIIRNLWHAFLRDSTPTSEVNLMSCA